MKIEITNLWNKSTWDETEISLLGFGWFASEKIVGNKSRKYFDSIQITILGFVIEINYKC